MSEETINLITKHRDEEILAKTQAKCPSKLDLIKCLESMHEVMTFVEQCAPLQGDRLTVYLAFTLQTVSERLNQYGYKLRDE
jgi:hypothetical protein